MQLLFAFAAAALYATTTTIVRELNILRCVQRYAASRGSSATAELVIKFYIMFTATNIDKLLQLYASF